MGRHHHHVDRPPLSKIGKLLGRMTAVQHVEVRVPSPFREVLEVREFTDVAADDNVRHRAGERSGDLDQPQLRAEGCRPLLGDRNRLLGERRGVDAGHDHAVWTPRPSLELRADDQYRAPGLAEHLFGDASEQRSTQPAATVAGHAHDGTVDVSLLENRGGDVGVDRDGRSEDVEDDIDHEIAAQRGDQLVERVGQVVPLVFGIGDTEQCQWHTRTASQCGGGVGRRLGEM